MPRVIEIFSFNRAQMLWALGKMSSPLDSRNVSGYMAIGGIIRLGLWILTLPHSDSFTYKPNKWILAL